ncbi:hypothetical protein [Streptomyces abikoensis]|uniref:Uncharacterized protein n=1 Tax=Streptomyces abikoensis TaxID=97398 RepID=A0ABW7T4K2_9ACTN
MTATSRGGPRSDDFVMAVHDFFDAEELLAFLDLAGLDERHNWVAQKLRHDGFSVRRLPHEPDPGATAAWEQTVGGFTYTVSASSGRRALRVSWDKFRTYVDELATPELRNRLRSRVTAMLEHEATYMPFYVPFGSRATWDTVFYKPWSRRLHDLRLAAVCARDAILPPVRPAPDHS